MRPLEANQLAVVILRQHDLALGGVCHGLLEANTVYKVGHFMAFQNQQALRSRFIALTVDIAQNVGGVDCLLKQLHELLVGNVVPNKSE